MIYMPTQETRLLSNEDSLQVGELHAGLLRGESGDQVHQGRRQSIEGIQTGGLELRSNLIHSLSNTLAE